MSRMPTTLTSSMSKITSSPSSGSLAKYWEGPPVRYISGTVKREISPWPRSWGHKYVQLLLGHAPWTTQTHMILYNDRYACIISNYLQSTYTNPLSNCHSLSLSQTATVSSDFSTRMASPANWYVSKDSQELTWVESHLTSIIQWLPPCYAQLQTSDGPLQGLSKQTKTYRYM